MKQISKILGEINYDTSKIKLVKCIGCHNEEGWIEYVLRNNYDEFDIIRIVEGAVEGRPKSTPDGHSTDRTLEIIRNFPDPDGKIELYTIGRPFKSLEEQKQVFIDVASEGEWLFIVDADEFYMEGDIERVRQAIHMRPTASEIIPTFLHFYRDKFHIRDLGPEWTLNHQRIIRYRPGMRYHTHPVATLPNGKCTYFSPEMQPDRYIAPVFIYHYGHLKSVEEHKRKAEFYRSELDKFEGTGGTAADAFDTKLDEFVNYKENLDEILHFDGKHPDVLNNHPQLNRIEEYYLGVKASSAVSGGPKIKGWRESQYYSIWPNVPTIPQWMLDWPWANRKMEPFYNVIEV